MNGIEAARRIRALVPESKIVALTQESDAVVAQELFSLGVSGYVVKERAARELLAAVETALQGKQFVSGGLEHREASLTEKWRTMYPFTASSIPRTRFFTSSSTARSPTNRSNTLSTHHVASRVAGANDFRASILDFSRATSFHVTRDAIRELAALPPADPAVSRPRVIVAPNILIYGLARMFQAIGETNPAQSSRCPETTSGPCGARNCYTTLSTVRAQISNLTFTNELSGCRPSMVSSCLRFRNGGLASNQSPLRCYLGHPHSMKSIKTNLGITLLFLVTFVYGSPSFAVDLPKPVQSTEGQVAQMFVLQLGSQLHKTGLDCSHLVHALYEHVGMNYPYATSALSIVELTNSNVVQPISGDLIVWRGHMGIVVDPVQHRF